jgi:hypothetical protein
MALPEAVLKRPRKAKVEAEPVQEVAQVEELPVGFATLDEALASLE